MGLLGSMVAGAVSGGAKARQAQLMEEIDAKRKESFLKLQQEYAQENAEFSNELAIGRDDAQHGKQVAYISEDNGQALTNAEFAALPEDKKAEYRRTEIAALESEYAKAAREDRKLDIQEQKNSLYEKKILGVGGGGSGEKPIVKQNEDGSFSVYDPESQTAKTVHTEESATARAEQETAMWAAEQGKGILNKEPSKEKQQEYFEQVKSRLLGGEQPFEDEMVTVSQGGNTYKIPRSLLQQTQTSDGVKSQPQPPDGTMPKPVPTEGILPKQLPAEKQPQKKPEARKPSTIPMTNDVKALEMEDGPFLEWIKKHLSKMSPEMKRKALAERKRREQEAFIKKNSRTY